MKLSPWHYAALMAVLLSACSKTSDSPLQWRSKIQLPISNESFYLGKKFPDLFKLDSTLSITGADIKGDTADTVAFQIKHDYSVDFETRHDSIKVNTFEDVLGAITISNSGTVTQQINFPVGVLNVDVPFSPPTATITLPKIYGITFDASSGPLTVTIQNLAGAQFVNCSLAVANLSPALPKQFVGTIAANGSATVSLAVAGRHIDSTAAIQISGTLAHGGTVAAGQGLRLSFSMDNRIASAATVSDSLVSINKVFHNFDKITDTVDIDYADIREGFFIYAMENHTGLDLLVRGIHNHLWVSSRCESDTIDTLSKLSRLQTNFDS
ncbi:MAG: hypothetical protein PHC61_16370, partial [Chitinivibrionales bacterium]|nr:hypothetical protein [Chitinivibrionales bacterium]